MVGGAGVAQPILDPPPDHWTCDLTSPDHSQQVLTCVAFTREDKWNRATPAFSLWILMLHTKVHGPQGLHKQWNPRPPGREGLPGHGQAAQLATPSRMCPEDTERGEGAGVSTGRDSFYPAPGQAGSPGDSPPSLQHPFRESTGMCNWL